MINPSNFGNPFIRRFPGDPDYLRNLSDIEKIERVSIDDRFTCHSTTEAIARCQELYRNSVALTFLPNGSADDTPLQWTYRQYREEINAAANLFHSLGLGYQESVGILMLNCPEMLFAIWGAEAAGIAAPINPYLEAPQIAKITEEAEVRILVTFGPGHPVGLWEKAKAVQAANPRITHIISVSGNSEGTLAWDEAINSQGKGKLLFERNITGREVASYFHTGGTTGTPKLAMRTHRSEVVNACQMAMTGVMPEDYGEGRSVVLCGLPLFHVSAVIASALKSMLEGAELILAGPSGFREPNLVKDLWKLVDRHKVSFFAVVPTVYSALLSRDSSAYDVSSIKLCGSGGSPLSVSLAHEFHQRTGAEIIEGYGMTECTACATTTTYRGIHKIGSVGTRLPYQQIRIVELDDRGNIQRECAENEIGNIILKGPNVIPAYKQESANKGAWPARGWLNTGDMGRCDADGFYWITGRSKDLIIRGGHNIDPLITEEALASHDAVFMVAAVGKPDAYAGELPVAYVQLNPGSSVSAEELKDYGRKHAVERAGAPTEIIVIEEMPLTAVGKVYKPDLRRDIIRRSYLELAESVLKQTRIRVQVEDDITHGLRVVIMLETPNIKAAEASEVIAPLLDTLHYPWEVHLN